MTWLQFLICFLIAVQATAQEGKSTDAVSNITLLLPGKLHEEPGLFLAGSMGMKHRDMQFAFLAKSGGDATQIPPKLKASIPLRRNDRTVFCLFVSGSSPFGTFQREINPSQNEVEIIVPRTLYAARWFVPESLVKSEKVEVPTARLIVLRVINDREYGTIYDANFDCGGKFKPGSDGGLYCEFYMPFIEPGIYEFSVASGKERRQRLRRRILLDVQHGTLLHISDKFTAADIDREVKQQPMTFFTAKDIHLGGSLYLGYDRPYKDSD